MSMMECRNCHKIADSRGFRLCPECGAPLCDDCANYYRGVCFECGEAMRERS